MNFILDQWLAILASAAAVWVYYAVAWMMLPHHAKDHRKLPDEDAVMAAIKGLSIPPGPYTFPHATTMKEQSDPAFVEKFNNGPCGMLNVWPKINMGRNMALSLLVYFIVSIFVAYLGSLTLPSDTPFLRVMQVTGTAGVMAYSFGFLCNAIWFHAGRNAIISNLVDGVIAGLITGALFGWLWK
ncbi:MAG: hypothetical protein KF859_04995 [Phycisphaeraceae bacterium]|nr:hypothetical protein [Phycisphaeraceae bacterium]